MPIQLPAGQQVNFGLPDQLESGVVNLINALLPAAAITQEQIDAGLGGGGGATNLSYTPGAASGIVVSNTGTDATLPSANGTEAGLLLPAEKTKLAGIATGATANAADATLLARANHTGTQDFSTLAGLPSTRAGHGITDAAPSTNILKAALAAAVQTSLDKADTALQTAPVSSVAGKTGVVTLAAADIGDSTAPGRAVLTAVSAAAQLALIGAQATLVSGTNIKTVGGTNLLGSGDVPVGGSVVLTKVRYVSTTGNDGTAVIGDITKPYASARTAVDACVAGDTVMLLPGSHTPSPPLILKKNVLLTSLAGRGSTEIVFPGNFPFQASSGSGQTVHGGQIQPATGISGVDSCYVSGLRIKLNMNLSGTYAAVTGVNTATGTASTGTGAAFCDLRVADCELWGQSDVHITIDAATRTYFDKCTLITGFDICHLIGPANIQHMVLNDSTVIYRPWYDTVTFNNGTVVDTVGRVRSGSLTMNNVDFGIYNDGTTDWGAAGYNLQDDASSGFCVDHFAGAKIIVDNLTFNNIALFPKFIRRFGSNAPVGTPSLGSLVVSGGTVDLCEYNSANFAHKSPPRIVPRNPIVLKATIFASAAASTTANNTYRCTAAATSQLFTMLTLPPGVAVKAAWIDRTTLFSGGASSAVTAEVGIVGSTAKYLAATDVKTTSGVATSAALQFVEGSGDVFTGAGTLVGVTIRTTGANVSTLTAGSVTVYIELAAAAGI